MKYPSVTEILKKTQDEKSIQQLERWKQRIGIENAEKISKESLERGIKYDMYIENYYKGIETPLNHLNEYLKMFKIHSLEQSIISEKYKYYGRYDSVFIYKNNLIINDFKGSEKEKDKSRLYDYPLQIAAYWNALKENGVHCNYGLITVILPDKIQPIKFTLEEMEYYFKIFEYRIMQYSVISK